MLGADAEHPRLTNVEEEMELEDEHDIWYVRFIKRKAKPLSDNVAKMLQIFPEMKRKTDFKYQKYDSKSHINMLVVCHS